MERRRKRGYKEKRDRGKEVGMEGGKEGKKEGGRAGRKKERKVGKGKMSQSFSSPCSVLFSFCYLPSILPGTINLPTYVP